MEIEDYFGFEYLSPHLMDLDASLNELNDLAGRLAVHWTKRSKESPLTGCSAMEVQRKVERQRRHSSRMQDLQNSGGQRGDRLLPCGGCAPDDAQLGRFYAENGFVAELDGHIRRCIRDAGLRQNRQECPAYSENGAFCGAA
ncbi:MAG: hypothetical protein ACLU3I_19060 [Acutalibacteraceae bacterium]